MSKNSEDKGPFAGGEEYFHKSSLVDMDATRQMVQLKSLYQKKNSKFVKEKKKHRLRSTMVW